MRVGQRLLGTGVIVAVLFVGPLAPLVLAQQPPPTARPEMFPETIKPAPAESPRRESMYEAGAAAANIVYVPGKAVLCTLGVVGAAAVMVVTFGTAYRGAAQVVGEGCAGKWVLGPEDLKPDRQDYRSP